LRSWVTQAGIGSRLACETVTSDDAGELVVERIMRFGPVLIQEWLPGRRDAVTTYFAHGKIWCTFAQRSYRELPVLGGASVLCESLPPLADIVEPATRLIRAIGLEGCAMTEFRRDQNGRPVLMEVNPRMPGSVSLAIRCGVDIPNMIYAHATGGSLRAIDRYEVGRRLRWLSGDVWSVKSSIDSQGQPDAATPLRAVARFAADFLVRPSELDIVDRHDMAPALTEWRQMLVVPAMGRVVRTLTKERRFRSQQEVG
jgi:hypothetical protein